jgi:hypothetical protein
MYRSAMAQSMLSVATFGAPAPLVKSAWPPDFVIAVELNNKPEP